jgi:hypothetical protein
MHTGNELEMHSLQEGRLSCDSDAPQIRSAWSDTTRVVKMNRKTNHHKTWPYYTSISHFRYDFLHQRHTQLSSGMDGPNTWHPWIYITWFLLWGEIWMMITFLTAHHFAGTQWEGRNCCGYSYTCHTYKLCTEYECRNMLWVIHGTLSKHLKPARRRSQHPDDITYQNTF